MASGTRGPCTCHMPTAAWPNEVPFLIFGADHSRLPYLPSQMRPKRELRCSNVWFAFSLRLPDFILDSQHNDDGTIILTESH